jgi:hypothetical protein
MLVIECSKMLTTRAAAIPVHHRQASAVQSIKLVVLFRIVTREQAHNRKGWVVAGTKAGGG